MKYYDVIVAGGGHAGVEASIAAAKMGCSSVLVTMDKDALGRMSCNPSIGGSAKGHLVHEIDALGGVMGMMADATGIQFRTLNRSKGPAVWAHRSQNDRRLYSRAACEAVASTAGLDVIEGMVKNLLVEDGEVRGVVLGGGEEISCRALVVCSGTFLNARMFTGLSSTIGGRFGEKQATGLTEALVALGFESGRLKTGTPPRLIKDSINYSVLQAEPGDENPQPFSYRTDKKNFPFLRQVNCYITYTNDRTHEALRKGFSQSPLFTGVIQGVGPRYCPSIEDKIVRFSERESHQLFIEPEGLETDTMYLAGFSSSLPAEVQLEAVRSIRGLEEVEMKRAGYAVEYDFFPPYQIDLTFETKKVKGLYFAGQINGTSGYEEAAAQGLLAGINAALKIQRRPELVLKRSEAYSGVLIDDLVTKSTTEPYRMFTSRAEHRLLLRQDNTDRRLMEYGYNCGLIPKDVYEQFAKKRSLIFSGISLFNEIKITPSEINPVLANLNASQIEGSETVSRLCRRPELKLMDLFGCMKNKEKHEIIDIIINDGISEEIETELKYEGYIKRQQEMVGKLERYENNQIPHGVDYFKIKSLSTEAREKLNKFRPRSIGQAGRISGVTPSDISILLVYLKTN